VLVLGFEFEFKVLCLARQVLYHMSHSPALSVLAVFLNRVSHLCPGQPGHDPPIYACYLLGITDMYHHAQVLTG
jgi:hypothetical protein